MKHLNVLIACEESQVECRAFRDAGHNAFSCDIQKSGRGANPEWHIKADVTRLLEGKTQFYTMDGKHHHLSRWHLIIAHPPCTYLCKVGSQHLYKNPDFHIRRGDDLIEVNFDRLMKMKQAREFFMKCLSADAPFVAVENPLPMALANLPKPSCYIHPFWFGDRWSKKTLFWLKNLPPLMAEKINPNHKQLVHCSRGKYRSRSSPFVAEAMVKQWTPFITQDLNINV